MSQLSSALDMGEAKSTTRTGHAVSHTAGLALHPYPEYVLRAIIATFVVFVQPLAPATITVSGGCTLVDAIDAANTDSPAGSCPAGSGADEIVLTGDIELSAEHNNTEGPNGLPSIISAITIAGNGRSIARSSAGGTDDFRIFHIGYNPPGNLILNDLAVTNGRVTGPIAEGGGIFNAGNLTLTNTTVSGNTASSVGGSAYGGGIYNTGYNGYGALEITNSTISNNAALGSSSGYYFSFGGGLVSFAGTLTITDSTVSENTVTGSYAYGGGIYSNDSGSIQNSTISSNGNSSIIYDTGSGLRISSTSFTVVNTTIAGNTGTYGYSGGISPSGTITWTATIVVDNTPLNCDVPPMDGGQNYADDSSCGAGFGTLTGLDANLADNGGPTMTHALLAGSSAIDAAGPCSLPLDQRGASRVGDCDSGAFEFIACPDLVLDNEAIDATETRENCQKITVGTNFQVTATGDLSLAAGKLIILANGTSVESDGRLRIHIDPDLQLIPPPP